MSAHTPGPWRVTGPNVRAGDALVAIVTNHWADEPTPDDEKASNARLIAAAPALLDAARCALADLEGAAADIDPSGDRVHPVWRTIDELRAAIERATGGAP